jgi:hypothetical protein
MKKKTLKGFHKTKHFLERQKQRDVSDQALIKAITSGELKNIDFGHSFKLGNLSVTIDLVNSTLITVHPGETALKTTKLLTKSEAKKIRELIQQNESKKVTADESEANDFLQYVKDFSIKKSE